MGHRIPARIGLRAHQWETPPSSSLEGSAESDGATAGQEVSAGGQPATHSVSLKNQLLQPVEVCSVPRWATRLLYSSVPGACRAHWLVVAPRLRALVCDPSGG